MPWSVGDVERHKKGLTPEQKKKWVKIANGVLKDCGSGSACEGKAIRIANAAFSEGMEMVMKTEKQKMPQSALHFMDHGCFAKAIDGEKVKLDMVVYSGGVIKNHFWWGNLSIDLNGMKFPKSKFPVLENHDQERKIGFSAKPKLDGNQIALDPEKTEFVETQASEEFIKLSKAGFPYESSMYAQPTAIERLEQGTSAEVNGMTVKGPATIWRQSVFKEASVCVFGWDSNTRSSAFANQEIEIPVEVSQLQETIIESEVRTKMDLTQFKAEHPDAYENLVAEVRGIVTTEVQAKFDKDKADLENKFQKESAEKDSQLADRDKRLLELEKKDAIRSENELRARAEKIWLTKLSDSNVPEHLYDKVMRHVSHSQFVKDGMLDAEKFGEAIDAEIKDWESKGVTSTVLGSGFGQKEVEEGAQKLQADEKLVEDTTNNLLSLAGQAPKKDQ